MLALHKAWLLTWRANTRTRYITNMATHELFPAMLLTFYMDPSLKARAAVSLAKMFASTCTGTELIATRFSAVFNNFIRRHYNRIYEPLDICSVLCDIIYL